jgi:hypothetical protein
LSSLEFLDRPNAKAAGWVLIPKEGTVAITKKARELKKGDRIRIAGHDGYYALAENASNGTRERHTRYVVETATGTQTFEVPDDTPVDVFLIEDLPTQID